MRRTRAITHVAIAAIAVWIGLAGCTTKPSAPEPPLPPAPPPESSSACTRIERIEVRKSERMLTAECTGGGRRQFPIALAREKGAKRMQGDQRMPEGDYRVAGAARTSRFHLFIPFDYPSRADADRALAEHRIDARVHAAIAEAHARGRFPPQDTPLGGALGIHGEGVRWRGDLDLNWTEGCVAVSDRVVEELARLVRRGTPIRILP